jgi:hypothetical protein
VTFQLAEADLFDRPFEPTLKIANMQVSHSLDT